MARPTTKERIQRMLLKTYDPELGTGWGWLPLGVVREALGPTADSAVLDMLMDDEIELLTDPAEPVSIRASVG